MGGNALSYKSVRLNKEVYKQITSDTLSKLRQVFPGRVQDIKAYRNKESFGDLDILIESTAYDPFLAAKTLSAVEVVRNGPVTSFGVKIDPSVIDLEHVTFQIDLIKAAPAEFEYTLAYFGFNDLGNLIGRTAHKAGLTHRHDGLFFYHRDGTYKFRELLLTQDHDKALEFLGYSAARYHQGFDDLEDIFQYVAGSSFFNRDIFLLENRNAQARVRDRKRKTYMEFLAWCEQHPNLPAYTYPSSKSVWLPRIIKHFPDFATNYAQSQADLALVRQLKSISNGTRVSALTGLKGKELGFVMKALRESFASKEDEVEFFLNASDEEYTQRVKTVQDKIQTESKNHV